MSGGPKVLGRVAFLDGRGDLPMLQVTTQWSTAEMYLHGAHVTHFQRKDEAPLLFLSQCSRFGPGQPIRGGIPIVFPWFGPREGLAQHGFARVVDWDLKEFAPAADGSVSVRFRLPQCPEAGGFPPFTAEYVVTVNQALTLQLIVKNDSPEHEFLFEECLHTYLAVSDVTAVTVSGLAGATYQDKLASFLEKTETNDAIRIGSEVDRTYLNTTGRVEVLDPRLGRRIHVEKSGSASTVLWNPWISKSQQMPDFGNDEYERMLCVESGNIAANSISLPPGGSSRLQVVLRSEALK
ncbi:MAG TPA: D-hexose-6-phosphate mutarotase [Candidatus Acidoferrum sp.]|nr:D-hexose-6-phosphate mutarotase [Candidatus Acidoferrum sp.]